MQEILINGKRKTEEIMIKIGSRESPLALIQAEIVKKQLILKAGLSPEEIVIVPIKTTGDTITDQRLIDLGGKNLFTKEIEEAVLNHDVDIAVHSMKDVETKQPEGLIIPCILEREDVRDVWISPIAHHPKDLPKGSKVGTASLRRGAQILNLNPDVKIVTFRGNVQTRLRKLQEGIVDGTVLALAGLKRLEIDHVATKVMSLEEMLPAPAQGALGAQCREDKKEIIHFLSLLNHETTHYCIDIERTFLSLLDGSCRTPIAAYARLEGENCVFSGFISDPQGINIISKTIESYSIDMKQKVIDLALTWRQDYKHMLRH